MKINLSLTRFQKFLEIISLIIMISMIIYLCISWSTLPDLMPSHYNAIGEPDNWSGKGTILILPIISIIIYLLLTGLLFISPEMINSPIEVTKENRLIIQKLSRDLTCFLKLIIISDFSYMTICTIKGKPLGKLFLPVFIFLTILPVIIYIIKIIKIKK